MDYQSSIEDIKGEMIPYVSDITKSLKVGFPVNQRKECLSYLYFIHLITVNGEETDYIKVTTIDNAIRQFNQLTNSTVSSVNTTSTAFDYIFNFTINE